MIDVKDLRIGNLIEREDKVCTVEVLFNSRLSVKWQSGDTIVTAYNANFEEIDGIPISPEWLMKLGFTYIYKDYQFEHEDNENVVILDNRDGYIFDYDFGGIEWCHCGVEYVHQLQNYFYLTTGEELTIGGGA